MNTEEKLEEIRDKIRDYIIGITILHCLALKIQVVAHLFVTDEERDSFKKNNSALLILMIF